MNDTNQLNCPECQATLSPSAAFCVNCGYRVRSAAATREPSDQTGELVARARKKARRSRQRNISANPAAVAPSAARRFDGEHSLAEPTLTEELPGDEQTEDLGSSSTASGRDTPESPRSSSRSAGRVNRDWRRASERGEADTPLELQRVGPGAQTRPSRHSPDTYIEGLPAVNAAQKPGSARQSTSADPAQEQGLANASSGAQRLNSTGAPSSQQVGTERLTVATNAAQLRRGRMPIYLAVWLSLSGVAILGTYALTARSMQVAPTQRAAVSLPAKTTIPAGSFQRGLDETVRSFIMQMCQRMDDAPEDNCAHNRLFKGEFPQRRVELPAFDIDTAEVTTGAYQACVKAGKCGAIDYKTCEVRTHLGLQVALRVPRALQQPEVAVSCVDQTQARDYCAFAGGKLPTSDQWEKAARGDDARLFPWGNVWSSNVANWGERDLVQNPIVGELDGFAHVAPPGFFPDGASPYGVHDMAGNVAEWVDTGPKNKPAARGGSWTSNPFELRATARLELDPDARRTDVGFRCAYP